MEEEKIIVKPKKYMILGLVGIVLAMTSISFFGFH